MGLSQYKSKRDFKQSPEPSGKKSRRGKKLKFVIQRHDASRLHYDLRLELDGVLKSWAVPKGPSMVVGDKRLAVMVEDHPIEYLNFYGEIPEGNYGAGVMDIFDSGTYKAYKAPPNVDEQTHLKSQLEKGDLKIVFDGTYIKGAFALVKIKSDEANNWLLIKKGDGFELKEFDIGSLKPKVPSGAVKKHKSKSSISSSKTKRAEDVWETHQKPMLATLTKGIVDQSGWIYELKYDGYRAVTLISNQKPEMVSRNGNSFNNQFQTLVKELSAVEDEVILDGEVVIENKAGVSEFQLLQNYSGKGKEKLLYYLFDILYLNGHSVINLPLRDRKDLLAEFLEGYSFKNIKPAPYVEGNGKEYYEQRAKEGHEGVIAKDSTSTYQPGKRSRQWLKVKATMSQEAIICGYALPQNSRKYFGSLILGVYEDGKLRHIGNAGTGFNDDSLKNLYKRFQDLITDTKPFTLKTTRYTRGKPVWLKPEMVCNVKFLSWTHDKVMRNPVFLGLRVDKPADEIGIEQTIETPANEKSSKANTMIGQEKDQILKFGSKELKLTNLHKEFWPEEHITKGELLSYYEQISSFILPYLKNRPQSLNRFPNGIKGPSFYQKDMEVSQLPKWVKTVKMYSKSNNRDIDYLIVNDLPSLLFMVNLGSIEINPWHSRYTNPDHPDYLMLDLDPGDISFKEVVNTAVVVKELCDELKMPCYCKTSGATGLHIYMPLGARYDYDQVKTFAEVLAKITQSRIPEVTTVERTVSKRGNKIYVDFLQNRKGQTIAAPYSVRPRPKATVSTPLDWDEVNHNLSPDMFTIKNAVKRFEEKGDLWQGVLKNPVNLAVVLKRIDKLK